MDERDLEPEEPAMRLLVDQVHALRGETPKLFVEVGDLVGDVVHPGAALGQELADRRVVPKRREQLDTALANPNGRRLDALLGDGFPPLDFGAEEPAVRVDGLVEILDRHPEMVDPLGLHAQGCYPLLTYRPCRAPRPRRASAARRDPRSRSNAIPARGRQAGSGSRRERASPSRAEPGPGGRARRGAW